MHLKVLTQLKRMVLLFRSVWHLLMLREETAHTIKNNSEHQPDLKPEVNLLRQQLIKCLSGSSRQFSGQHDSNEGPWCLGQGVGEHIDAGGGQQHGRARRQRVEPVTHLGGRTKLGGTMPVM